MPFPPFPNIGADQKPATRQDVIDGLRDCYQSMVQHERVADPTIKGYPDMEKILDYIEQHGLPPKS